MRSELQPIVNECGTQRVNLIEILQKVQKRWNYLPPEMFTILPEITDISVSEISSVVSFYRSFRLEPAGKHEIKVCVGTACHVKGADKVYQAFKNALNIDDENDTDADGLFTVSKVACLGCWLLYVGGCGSD